MRDFRLSCVALPYGSPLTLSCLEIETYPVGLPSIVYFTRRSPSFVCYTSLNTDEYRVAQPMSAWSVAIHASKSQSRQQRPWYDAIFVTHAKNLSIGTAGLLTDQDL
jgi:hypothetical protein